MLRQDVKMIVVACNTASSVAIDAVARESGLPVLGVIRPGANRAAELSRSGAIGVIGTRATVGSGAYERAIHERRPEARVISRSCPLFVPLAEEGWTDNDIAAQVARTYLAPFRQAGVDALVLGCTHYPLLRGVIGEAVGPEVQLVDSAESTAAETLRLLEADRSLAADGGAERPAHRFFVTDAPEPFQAVAERFLGRTELRLERTRIEGE
jgi:glutamate racemase